MLAGSLAACAADVSAVVPVAGGRQSAGPVVVIGDSITRGHGLRAWQAWPEVLAARLHVRVVDLACDGAGVLAEGDDQCAATYEGLAQQAAALHPSLVLVQASSNDLGQDDDELDGASTELVSEVRRLAPAARVVGLSALWDQDAPPAQLATISAALRSAVERDGGTWIDVGQPLHGHPGWMQSDDVHPTERGQLAVAAAVRRAMASDHVRW